MSDKNPHALVGQGVDQIQTAHEQITDAQEQKIVVIQDIARIPGDDKEGYRDDNAEKLGQAVKKEVAVKAGKIEAHQDQKPGKSL